MWQDARLLLGFRVGLSYSVSQGGIEVSSDYLVVCATGTPGTPLYYAVDQCKQGSLTLRLA